MDLVDYNLQVERTAKYQQLTASKAQLTSAKEAIEDNSNTIANIRLEITGKNSILIKNSESIEAAMLTAINQALADIEADLLAI